MSTQTFIPGTEPPTDAELDEPLFAMLEAQAEAKRHREQAKQHHATLVARLEAKGVPYHPYQDPRTGKKRRAWAAKETKIKTSAVKEPKPPKEKRGRRRRDREDDAEIVNPDDNVVTMRRVSLASVAAEIDPFASVRGSLEER